MGSQAASGLKRLGLLVAQPFIKTGTWYNNTAKKHPFTCGVITTGFKTSAADIFAQKVIERRDEIDFQRHAIFCAFGFTYLGAFQYWLYNIKFTQWCGPITKRFGHIGTAPVKVFIDQAIHHPFCYFPVFFTMKTLMQGKDLSAAFEKYKTDIWDSCKTLWTIWVPAQLVNFAFVPRHMRIPFVAGVSFAWCVILSVMQGKLDTQANTAREAAGRVIEQALDVTGHPEETLKPVMKPVSAPSFASTGVVPGTVAPTAMHSTSFQQATELRKL